MGGVVPIRRDGRDPMLIDESRRDLEALAAIRAALDAEQRASILKAAAALDKIGLLDRTRRKGLTRETTRISPESAAEDFAERLLVDLGDMIDGDALQACKDNAR